MKKIRITVMRMACYKDLMEEYENPMEHACDMHVGQVFIANGWEKPEGLCESAWQSMSPFVMTLAHGGTNIYEGWMKNERSAMISCNDGFRPVSFLRKHSNKCTFYSLRFGCSFAVANTIKPQLL